jgi:hypothetical protein
MSLCENAINKKTNPQTTTECALKNARKFAGDTVGYIKRRFTMPII